MSCDPVAHISKCYDVKPNDQISLKNAVFQQPVAVAIEADTRYFQMYSHGVLDSLNVTKIGPRCFSRRIWRRKWRQILVGQEFLEHFMG